MKMKTNVCSVLIFACLILSMCTATSIRAQDLLQETGQLPYQYLIKLSGTVLNERFSGAEALLTLGQPVPGSLNPYLVIITGFPKKNSRNSIFWNSEFSTMTCLPNEITCDINKYSAKLRDIHFFYLSPSLLEQKPFPFVTQLESQRKQMTEKVVLPSKVYVKAGKLRIKFSGNSVSGTVWMNGFDAVERSYVKYSAQFYGKKATGLKPQETMKKEQMKE